MEVYLVIPNEMAIHGFAVVKELGKFYVMENGTRWSNGFWSYEEALGSIRRSLR